MAAGHQGQVLGGELVLQGLGGGGHHHPLAGQGGGDQVGQGLAGAGAGLHHQVAAAGHGPAHRRGHLAAGRVGTRPRRAAPRPPRPVWWPPRRSSADPTAGRPGRAGRVTSPAPTPTISATPQPGRRRRPARRSRCPPEHAAGSRRPIAAADLAADDRSRRRSARPPTTRRRWWRRRGSPATALTMRASTFLVPLRRCRSSSMKMASRAMRIDALGGAEVAAVDAGEEDPDQQGRRPRGPAGRPALEPGAHPGLEAISTEARAMRAGTAALNTLWGRARSRIAPMSPPTSDADPSWISRRRCPTSSRR